MADASLNSDVFVSFSYSLLAATSLKQPLELFANFDFPGYTDALSWGRCVIPACSFLILAAESLLLFGGFLLARHAHSWARRSRTNDSMNISKCYDIPSPNRLIYRIKSNTYVQTQIFCIGWWRHQIYVQHGSPLKACKTRTTCSEITIGC